MPGVKNDAGTSVPLPQCSAALLRCVTCVRRACQAECAIDGRWACTCGALVELPILNVSVSDESIVSRSIAPRNYGEGSDASDKERADELRIVGSAAQGSPKFAGVCASVVRLCAWCGNG